MPTCAVLQTALTCARAVPPHALRARPGYTAISLQPSQSVTLQRWSGFTGCIHTETEVRQNAMQRTCVAAVAVAADQQRHARVPALPLVQLAQHHVAERIFHHVTRLRQPLYFCSCATNLAYWCWKAFPVCCFIRKSNLLPQEKPCFQDTGQSSQLDPVQHKP